MDASLTLKVNQLTSVRQGKALFAPLSFTLHAGEALLIEGPNGVGKSSLLRLLTGLAAPALNAGEIFWGTDNIARVRNDYWQALHYLGHANGLKMNLSISENIHLAATLANRTVQPDEQAIVADLHLCAHINRLIKHLSAGQKRRVALAILFILKKPLWIIDEPFTALDAATQAFFLLRLDQHLTAGGMAVISSHHPILHKNAQCFRLISC